jgi:hypothetical protein
LPSWEIQETEEKHDNYYHKLEDDNIYGTKNKRIIIVNTKYINMPTAIPVYILALRLPIIKVTNYI